MTFQEILDGITAHRANPMPAEGFDPAEVRRKLDEIEWALQAICEKLRDSETP